MSGTFQDINVPPMLMAFGITNVDANNVVSTDLKAIGNNIYLIEHCHNDDFTPNVEQLKKNYDFISQEIENKRIISAFAVGFGGVAEAICKMAFGNEIGIFIEPRTKNQEPRQAEACHCGLNSPPLEGVGEVQSLEDDLFNLSYGSVMVETPEKLDYERAVYLGKTIPEKVIKINSEEVDLETLYKANTEKFADVYPLCATADSAAGQ